MRAKSDCVQKNLKNRRASEAFQLRSAPLVRDRTVSASTREQKKNLRKLSKQRERNHMIEKRVDVEREAQEKAAYYCPRLNLHLKSVIACLLVSYLEIHHPAPEDASGRVSSLPVIIDLDQISRDLHFSRRTLRLNFCQIAVWVRSEAERSRAARAGREFLKPSHTRYGKIKLYSLVGRNSDSAGIRLQLRRNKPYLDSILEAAGISWSRTDGAEFIPANPEMVDTPVSPRSLPIFAEMSKVLQDSLSASSLGSDRRHSRYDRLRSAVDRGLLPRDVLGVKKRGKSRNCPRSPLSSPQP